MSQVKGAYNAIRSYGAGDHARRRDLSGEVVTAISIEEARARLYKARKLAHWAKHSGYTAEDIANDKSARRTTLAYAGYLERGASIETWKQVLIIMTEDEDNG